MKWFCAVIVLLLPISPITGERLRESEISGELTNF